MDAEVRGESIRYVNTHLEVAAGLYRTLVTGGKLDPLDFEEYVAKGGFQALRKCLTEGKHIGALVVELVEQELGGREQALVLGLERVDGVNITLWKPGGHVGGSVNGLALGLGPRAGFLRGVSIGLLGVLPERAAYGVTIGGLGIVGRFGYGS